MLSIDVYGRGKGAIPRSKLTWASELPGPEDLGRKKGRQDPRRLSSHPAAARAEVPGERGGKEKGVLMRGKRVVKTPETEVWT